MSNRSGQFWDRRAEEDAFFFVDNRQAYGAPDLERFWSEGEQALDNMLDVLGASISRQDRVLEIGCGVGRLTRSLAARGASVRALDVSERMLELAREYNHRLDNVEWILGDGSSLTGVDSASVDVCISHVVFQHIPDPEITLTYLREIGRVLRPGGWAAFQFSNDASLHQRPGWTSRAGQLVRSLAGRSPRGQGDPHWVGSMLEIEDLRRVARDAQMRIDKLVGEGTPFCCALTVRLDSAEVPAADRVVRDAGD